MAKRKIGHEWMPQGVTIKKNRYVYQEYLGCENGKPRYKEFTIGRIDKVTKSYVWQWYEDHLGITDSLTIQKLLDRYSESPEFNNLGDRTKTDYKRYYKILCNLSSSSGPFGNLSVQKITPGVIRRYLDKRAEQNAPISGNKEIGYLSSAFTWALDREYVENNPCIKVKRNKRNQRKHYVADEDYYHAMILPGPWYIPYVMELCYLCRLRENEALRTTRADWKNGKLWARRGKGSKDSLVHGDRLTQLIEACFNLPLEITPIDPEKLPLIHDKKGRPITVDALQSAWKRRMPILEALGGQRFWLHDLKRKAVSDFKGNKLKASGHRDPKMLEIYDVLPEEVESTR